MFLLSSLSVVWLPLGSKTAEQITLDIFQNCDVPEEESLTFDPEVDLNDDAVGKARYERFFFCSQPAKMRQKLSLRRRSREPTQSSGVPLKPEGTDVAC